MSGFEVILISGENHTLTSRQATDEVKRLSAGVQERITTFIEPDYVLESGIDATGLCNALRTPALLADRRVIVARDFQTVGGSKERLKQIGECLREEHLAGDVIFVWESGSTVPKFFVDIVKNLGGICYIFSNKVSEGQQKKWLQSVIQKTELQLDKEAEKKLGEWAGTKQSKIYSLLPTLQSTFGSSEISLELLSPFLSDSYDIPIWKLGDSIDTGDRAQALFILNSLFKNGFHELQIFSYLHKHFEQILALQGVPPSASESLASIAGLPPNMEFVASARKRRAEQLGIAKLRQAFQLLSDANMDLKGRSGLDGSIVLDVLVARLASLDKWK